MTNSRRQFVLLAICCAAVPADQVAAMPEPTRAEMERRLRQVADALLDRSQIAGDGGLSAPERVFRCVWELEAEVNNGGFDQYFFNASGHHAPDAPFALRAIGADSTAALVDEALRAVGRGIIWGDADRRREAINHASDAAQARLARLDTKFYAYPDDLTALLYRYVDNHRTEFRESQ